jgi:hypothetical protein
VRAVTIRSLRRYSATLQSKRLNPTHKYNGKDELRCCIFRNADTCAHGLFSRPRLQSPGSARYNGPFQGPYSLPRPRLPALLERLRCAETGRARPSSVAQPEQDQRQLGLVRAQLSSQEHPALEPGSDWLPHREISAELRLVGKGRSSHPSERCERPCGVSRISNSAVYQSSGVFCFCFGTFLVGADRSEILCKVLRSGYGSLRLITAYRALPPPWAPTRTFSLDHYTLRHRDSRWPRSRNSHPSRC